jgi:Cu/Ag efflux pump CusA
MEAEKKELTGILKKMGVEFTPEIAEERALAKLIRSLQKLGVPGGLSAREKEIVKAMGFKLPAKEPEAKKEEKTVKKHKAPAPARKVVGKGAFVAFKEMFEKKAEHVRDDVIKSLPEKFEVCPGSIRNYISLAKKDKKHFGFRLIETKNSKGIRILTRK